MHVRFRSSASLIAQSVFVYLQSEGGANIRSAKKNERNVRERGLHFGMAAEFDFESAIFFVDARRAESRRIAVGYLGNRLHVLCYLPLANGIRVISFRKANQREAVKYGKSKIIDRA